jgi:hypothetical protein
MVLASTPVLALANGSEASKGQITVLERAKAGDYPGALDAVDELDKQGKKADTALIGLLDYYLGEGPTEVMSEAITRRGKRMLKALNAKRRSEIQCLPAYATVCMTKFSDGLELRNEYIERLATAIRKGKVLRAAP